MKLRGGFAASLTAILLAGCSSMPLGSSGLHDTSRTGKVHDITIMGNEVTPKKITVQPGDEIRWVNHRTAPVRVTFTDPLEQQKLSCQRNFAHMTGLKHSTKIGASESASLCFASPGTLTYMVRMEESVPGKELIDTGSIEVTSAPSAGTQSKGQEISQR
jgi:plastocyanin